MIVWQILFWLSIFFIFHSYVLFPWILQLLASGKKENELIFGEEALPAVTVVMSIYNEELVLQQKLDSLLKSDYPAQKLQLLIGSDASTDRSNEILQDYAKKHPFLTVRIFKDRQGKPRLINRLVEETSSEVLILTDANVIFEPGTIKTLARHFKNPALGIVGGNILNEGVFRDGVSIQEKAFMSREILMKYREGKIWGSTIGVEGSVYAIRRSDYTPVPGGYSVDDFYITMCVLERGKKAIMELRAQTREDVSNQLSEEYRRKVRISTGNFKNLWAFRKMLLTPWKGASFAFFSHKVIRWLGPFVMALVILFNTLLYNVHEIYQYTLWGFSAIALLPFLDLLLSKIGIHIVFLRFIRHFLSMNVALFHGFINNIRGIRHDVWQPTKRK